MAKFESIFAIGVFISSLILFFSPISVSAKETWEDQGLEWYYDNLTDEDRQKIRQAMDYAIPREKIINDRMGGSVLPVATDIASNMMGYDSSFRAREFNLTKSKDLLADVFGKRYENRSVAKANATITNTPYFKLTLIEPTSSVARRNELDFIAQEFNKIGIETEPTRLSWTVIMPRIFLYHKTHLLGADFDHEGFDSFIDYFVGTTDPNYSGQYYPESFVPTGDNLMYIERPDLIAIINRSLQELKFEDREQALKDYQWWFFNWVPKCIIGQYLDLFLQSPDWVGFDPYLYGRYPWVHNMTRIGGPGNSFTSVVPGPFFNFNPLLSYDNSYDAVWQSNVFLRLAGRRGLYNLSHCYPLLATSWNSSSDGREWIVTLREGVKWHDGTNVTVDDVIFSYEAAYVCPNSIWINKIADWFDYNATWIEKMDARTVKFTLQAFYPYVESGIFALPILQKAQLESIDLVNWKTDGTNTGLTPLIGCGPYKITSFNVSEGITCEKYDGWNATLMGHNPTAVGGGIWLDTTNGPIRYNIVVDDDYHSGYSVTKLEYGVVQLLDPSFNLFGRWEEFEAADWCNPITAPEYIFKVVAFNHYDPRWGLNPHDPREMYPEDYPDNPSEIFIILNRILPGSFSILIIILFIFLLNRKKFFE